MKKYNVACIQPGLNSIYSVSKGDSVGQILDMKNWNLEGLYQIKQFNMKMDN